MHQPKSIYLLLCFILPIFSTELLCPSGCSCNQTSASCTNLSGLIRFNHTSALESLDLSNNSLRKITSHLDKFTNLHTIDLSNNRLSEVNKLPKGIKDLNLNNNQITSAKLSKIPKSVEKLNLSNNHVTYLPYSIMTLKNLRSIELYGNPINCTCETLAVRNWLKQQHVWSSSVVTCSSPLQFKGKPWLQVKQVHVCEVKLAPTRLTDSKGSKYNWDDIEDNELMQGDQPIDVDHDTEGSGEEDDYDDGHIIKEDEIEDEKEYPTGDEDSNEPIADHNEEHNEEKREDHHLKEVVRSEELLPVHSSTTDPNSDYEDDEEGSGEHPIVSSVIPLVSSDSESSSEHISSPIPSSLAPETASSKSDYDEYEDGSGDDVIIPVSVSSSTEPSTTESEFFYEEPEMTEPTLPDLGIFGVDIESSTSISSTEGSEETTDINTGILHRLGNDVVTESPPKDGEEDKDRIMQARTNDNRNTFILLGVLGALLICLIIYVAVKDKSSKRNRRNQKKDLETGPSTEMKDMDKNLLGKEKNGNQQPIGKERTPLMFNSNEKPANGHGTYPGSKIDDVDHPASSPPPLSSFKPIVEEPLTSHNNNNDYPQQNGDSSEVPTIESPISQPKRYSPVYTPRTPKLGNNSDPKYSPVYSPETGRVKIKATEIPKSKTPVLVTRTKSSAGDYITTPEVH